MESDPHCVIMPHLGVLHSSYIPEEMQIISLVEVIACITAFCMDTCHVPVKLEAKSYGMADSQSVGET